ncbi:hypothetical protein ABZ465_25705 [Streptomyces griseoincarnatus]
MSRDGAATSTRRCAASRIDGVVAVVDQLSYRVDDTVPARSAVKAEETVAGT